MLTRRAHAPLELVHHVARVAVGLLSAPISSSPLALVEARNVGDSGEMLIDHTVTGSALGASRRSASSRSHPQNGSSTSRDESHLTAQAFAAQAAAEERAGAKNPGSFYS